MARPSRVPRLSARAALQDRHGRVLGVVGAGGIGHQLSDRIRVNAWDQVAFIVVLILAAVAVIDALSRALRRSVLGEAGARRAI